MKYYSRRWRQAVALLLALATCLSLTGCDSSVNRFESYVRRGDSARAIDYYWDQIAGHTSEEQMAAKFLSSYLDAQLDAYAAGKLSGAECERTLETVQYINDELYIVGDELWYAEDYYDCLATSKQAYAEAAASLEDGCYLEAAYVLAYVDQRDTEHYGDAQRKLEQALHGYEEQQMEMLQDAVSGVIENYSVDDSLYEWCQLGVSNPAAQETCNRLISTVCWYLLLLESDDWSPRDTEYVKELEENVEEELKEGNAKQYFGAEDALDWIDISFDQELINDSERIRQKAKAG